MREPIHVPWSRLEFPQFIDEHGYNIGAEIGVDKGEFSAQLLKYSHLDMLHSVDPWAHGRRRDICAATASSLLGRFGGRSVIHRACSLQVAAEFAAKGGQLDFIYIDGDHRQQPVTDDISSWWPLMRYGGCLAGHDYLRIRKCGVIPAVDAFVTRHNLQLHLTCEVEWASWFVFKY